MSAVGYTTLFKAPHIELDSNISPHVLQPTAHRPGRYYREGISWESAFGLVQWSGPLQGGVYGSLDSSSMR